MNRVWSIGTGLIPKSNDLFKTIDFIKKKLKILKFCMEDQLILKIFMN